MGRGEQAEAAVRASLRLRRIRRRLARADRRVDADGLDADFDDIEGFILRDVETVPKGVAARLLGVSRTALDRWVGAGIVPVVGVSPHRAEIEKGVLLRLVEEVTELREVGRKNQGIVALAIQRLAEEDSEYQHRLAAYLDENAPNDDRWQWLTVPEEFGPED